jgi:hypothetical protein
MEFFITNKLGIQYFDPELFFGKDDYFDLTYSSK